MIVHGICHKQKEMVLKNIKNNILPNAIFFDLDDNSKKNTDLPHMLVEKMIGKK